MCNVCYGYGWWPIGALVPIGKMDSREWGKRIIKCVWCGEGHVSKGERWDALVGEKKRREKEKNEKANM